MTDNQIDSAWMIQDNVIFIKQFGIKTKEHNKLESTPPIPLPNTHGLNTIICTSELIFCTNVLKKSSVESGVFSSN